MELRGRGGVTPEWWYQFVFHVGMAQQARHNIACSNVHPESLRVETLCIKIIVHYALFTCWFSSVHLVWLALRHLVSLFGSFACIVTPLMLSSKFFLRFSRIGGRVRVNLDLLLKKKGIMVLKLNSRCVPCTILVIESAYCHLVVLRFDLFSLFVLFVLSLWLKVKSLSRTRGQSSSSEGSEIDQYDPLFLHSNDTSGVPLINFEPEGTENYNIWKAAITIANHTKNKLGFINGKLKRPEDEGFMQEQWNICNFVVLN
ncbi:ribonuclease H-like domain-containing protein [Tanacetum coccineum]